MLRLEVADDWEALVSAGVAASQDEDEARWAHGDLAGRVQTRYGAESLARFASAIGSREKTLRDRLAVARFYPPEHRTFLNLRWSHYRIAQRGGGTLEEALQWLERAADDNWSVERLEGQMKNPNSPQVRKIADFTSDPAQSPERLLQALEAQPDVDWKAPVIIRVYQERP